MSDLMLHALFGLGGGLGALCRHAITILVTHRFPLSTLIVNVVGCFILGGGLVVLPGLEGFQGEEERRIIYGFCGGFTTFSSFAFQSLDLHRQHSIIHAAANILLSLFFCLIAFFVGHWLAVQLWPPAL